MIYYFTALVISYSMDPDTVTKSYVWYDRERHCIEAMNEGLMDGVYDQLHELYGNDIMMQCQVSDQASFILRPKLRPEEE